MTDYYPFGASHSTSWTRETATPNPYLYNAGAEKNEKTGWYETYFRSYDAYTGRFNQVDPLASKYGSVTPYNYAFNSPVVLNDPLGDDPRSSKRGGYSYASMGGCGCWQDKGPQDASSGGAGWNNATYGTGADRFGTDYLPGEYYGVGGANGSIVHQQYIADRRANRARQQGLDRLYGQAWSATPGNAWGIFEVSGGKISSWAIVSIDQSNYNLIASSSGIMTGPSLGSLWGEFWDKYLPVAVMYGIDGDLVVGPGAEGTIGFGLILRGPDAGNLFGVLDGTTHGPLAVGSDISVSLQGMWVFYTGDSENFNASMLEGFRHELSVAFTLGIDIGVGGFRSATADPLGGYVYGVGGSFGLGAPVPPLPFSINYNFGSTVIWGK